jgi:hypothetical protein
MKSRGHSFNIYFALLCLALIVADSGCSTIDKATGRKKEETTIRLYLESDKPDSLNNGTVLVTSNRVPFVVQREPFLDEGDLAKASIVNDASGDGGYMIHLTFDDHATLVLNMTTSANQGKHIIIFSQFPKKGYKPPKEKFSKGSGKDDADLVENGPGAGPEPEPEKGATNEPRMSGWLAAVMIRQPISNGQLYFTPDASRAEGFRIVRGLRNVIEEARDADSQ